MNEPQNLEREEDAVFFDQVFHTDVVAILSQINTNGKKVALLTVISVVQQLFLKVIYAILYSCTLFIRSSFCILVFVFDVFFSLHLAKHIKIRQKSNSDPLTVS